MCINNKFRKPNNINTMEPSEPKTQSVDKETNILISLISCYHNIWNTS